MLCALVAYLHHLILFELLIFFRRPMLEGDNWWRGHAAAFLKYVNMPPEALRRGRVSQVRFTVMQFCYMKFGNQ